MILTVTLNPAVDTKYRVEKFGVNSVNRIDYLEKTPGGKGLNLSRVAKKLGTEILATGFLGGRTGDFIEEKLNELSIGNSFTKILGETRICIAIVDKDTNTELLEKGPNISREEWELFKVDFSRNLKANMIVCASGSLPQGLNSNSYGELMNICREKNIKFFLDSSGNSFRDSIAYKPFFIKPNREELEQYFGKKIETLDEIIQCGKILENKGIENVLITLGGEGAILLNNGKVYRATLPKYNILNTVGSGDSTVAGFAHGIKNNFKLIETLKLALACGTSNALLEKTGDIDIKKVEEIKEKIKIEVLNEKY